MKKYIYILFLLFCLRKNLSAQDSLGTVKIFYQISTSFTVNKDDISDIEKPPSQAFNLIGNLEILKYLGNFKTSFTSAEANPKTVIRRDLEGITIDLKEMQGLKTARISNDTSVVGQIMLQQLKQPTVQISFQDSSYVIKGITVKKAIVSEINTAFTTEIFYAPEILLPKLTAMGKQHSGLYFLPGTNDIPFLIVKGRSTMASGAVMAIELIQISKEAQITLTDFNIPKGYQIINQ